MADQKTIKKITGGLYLVVDPTAPDILTKLQLALEGGVDVVQVWDHWPAEVDKPAFINDVCGIAFKYQVPVIINNDWKLISETNLAGVHFDHLPQNFDRIKASISKQLILGVTCGNDERVIDQAIGLGVDYLSFCAMYPSLSVNACDIVTPEMIRQTRMKTSLPIFVSGGVTPDNLPALLALGASGVAVVSGILKSAQPDKAAAAFKRTLKLRQ